MKTGIELIAEERQRQVDEEGWTAEHDDAHEGGVLGLAACCYIMVSADALDQSGEHFDPVGELWPWEEEWWKPSDPIRNLTKAGALIAAEIDRLQRVTED